MLDRRSVAGVALALAVAFAVPLAAQAPVATEFNSLHFRSIGPATMSGRIADIAVYEADPAIWYIGAAHGGVWKTTSNGAIMTPLLQDQGLLSIGDIAVSQLNPDIVYVGTGESNNRQSTSWGDGMWKTTDGGKTWTHIGLENSRHINRIVLDPTNNDIVFVAATGPLFGPGGDRGVYKSTDGGKTWRRVLFVDDDTGANDLVMSMTDPNILFASTYQRRRSACCMNGGGPGSGIWKSTDAGEHWTRLTNGLPSGSLGRIGLDVYRRTSNIVYASIEGPAAGRGEAPPAAPAGGGGGGRGGRGGRGGGGRGGAGRGAGGADMSAMGVYRSDDGGATWRKLSSNNPRPMYFSQVRIDPNNPDRVYMGGVGMQMTIDGGRTWETDAALAVHDDIHAIWLDPNNSDHLMVGNDGGVYVSYDMAQHWQFVPNLPVGLFYHVSYDMETPYNVCGGMQDNYDWCGPSRSRFTAGIMNYDWYTIHGGDGFVALSDLRDSRFAYSESQDGNITRMNKVTGESKSIRPTAANVSPAPADGESYRFHWDTPMMFSPNDPGTLLVAANKVFKSTDRGDSWTVISPDLTSNADRDEIVTMGVKGSDIHISKDDGISAWPTIVALAESPKQAGVYYAGTDDGNLQVSKDGGKSWQNITSHVPGFPTGGFVSRVAPSRYDAGTVYVTVDNHRLGDFKTYIWVSKDYGATFTSLNGNLSDDNARTITEDTKNPDVLYLGTETGLRVSLDRGKSWRRLVGDNFPTVRVDEITINPGQNSMLLATHGRAIWILDDLSPIQEYTATVAAAGDAHLFTPGPALEWKPMDNRNDEFWGHQTFIGENPPLEAVVAFHLKRSLPGLTLRVTSGGRTIRDIEIPQSKNAAGIQMACWDQRGEPVEVDTSLANAFGGGRGGRGGGGRGGPPAVPGIPNPVPSAGYLPSNPCDDGGDGGGRGGRGRGGNAGAAPFVTPGTYTVQLVSGNAVLDSKPLRVVGDPAVQMASADRRRYDAIANDLQDLHSRASAAASALNALNEQVEAAAPKVRDGSAPANVKSEFEAFVKDFDAVKKKFGVGAAAGGGGRGGGRGGAPLDPENVLGRIMQAKASVTAFWEMPSASVMREYNEVKSMLPRAIADANASIARASAMSQTLKAQGITLTVPDRVR